MRGDTGPTFGTAHRINVCAEYGLHFRKDGDHWRCVELPELLMVPCKRYRVGDCEFATLGEAVRHLSGAAAVP
jgi:hypothetical protein